MQLNGKRIVLTGATGGIGREIATALHRTGASLLVTGRSAEKLAQLQQTLTGIDTIVADLSDALDRRRLCDRAAEFAADMLINAAGVNQLATLPHTSDRQMIQMMHTNLLIPMQLCRDMLPVLQQREQAAIVNVGSILGSIGYAGSTVYCASKFGLRGFTEALRRELADSNISVIYFAPRATDTGMNTDTANAMNRELGVKMDAPEWVAAQLVELLRAKKPHSRYLGWPEKLFVRINSILPGVVDGALLKQLPVIRRFADQ